MTAVIQNTVKGLQTQLEARFRSVETNVTTLTQHMGNAEAHITAINNQLTEVMKKQSHFDSLKAQYPDLLANVEAKFFAIAQSYSIIFRNKQSYMWSPDCQLGIDGFRGVVRMKNDLDVWNLIEIKQVSIRNGEEQFTFEPNFEELEGRGITRGTIMTRIESQ
ncbi:unnamed protein product, partial [Prorocentrum cordatum]